MPARLNTSASALPSSPALLHATGVGLGLGIGRGFGGDAGRW
jgi:hypothetical protein